MNSKIFSSANFTQFLASIPKADVHLHLDGSIRLSTIVELAKKDGVDLPSYTVEWLEKEVFKDSYADLPEYLRTFGYSCAVLQNPENLERVGFELAEDNIEEGVRYVEVRYAPQLLINEKQNGLETISSVAAGMKKAADRFNSSPAVKSGESPEFRFGIIICALRNFGPYSKYYSDFIESFLGSESKDFCAAASISAVNLAINLRDKHGLPVVAFDIAGAENGFPPQWHIEAFRKAKQAMMPVTIHAGEAFGPESIYRAVVDCGANRIGHGIHIVDHDSITDKRIQDQKDYTKKLIDYCGQQEILMEVCPTSNLQTLPTLKNDMKNHPLGQMLRAGLEVSVNTDNRTVSKTSVVRELTSVTEAFSPNQEEFKRIILSPFRKSFFPGSAQEKREYVAKIEAMYDKLAANL